MSRMPVELRLFTRAPHYSELTHKRSPAFLATAKSVVRQAHTKGWYNVTAGDALNEQLVNLSKPMPELSCITIELPARWGIM